MYYYQALHKDVTKFIEECRKANMTKEQCWTEVCNKFSPKDLAIMNQFYKKK